MVVEGSQALAKPLIRSAGKAFPGAAMTPTSPLAGVNSVVTPMIFFRVGWMRNYMGVSVSDKISGGGAFVESHGFGYEMFNFLPFNNMMYGYVRPIRGKGAFDDGSGIKLERIGGGAADADMGGVLVVWIAKHPKGGTYLIGWYHNATVYRACQTLVGKSNRVFRAKKIGYYASAKSSDCVLLDSISRTFMVPSRTKDFPGTSNVWYADAAATTSLRQNVVAYIEQHGTHKRPRMERSPDPPRQPDPKLRRLVEDAAMAVTASYFERKRYAIKYVHRDNLGWDLEAVCGKRTLLLEAKGLMGSRLCIELTPNELTKMWKHRDVYCVCVVTNALKSPELSVFTYAPEIDTWQDQRGRELVVERRDAARCYLRT